jgi:hypothetical protein
MVFFVEVDSKAKFRILTNQDGYFEVGLKPGKYQLESVEKENKNDVFFIPDTENHLYDIGELEIDYD